MNNRAFTWARSQRPALRDATVSTLRAEASSRAFYRLSPAAGPSLVLMLSPPEQEQNEQFERLAAVFGKAGIPVPSILAADRARGWFLLTDLGCRELAQAYDTPAEAMAIETALATLLRLQAVSDPAVPPYTQERFTDELGIFADWFAAAFLGVQLPAAITPVFRLLV